MLRLTEHESALTSETDCQGVETAVKVIKNTDNAVYSSCVSSSATHRGTRDNFEADTSQGNHKMTDNATHETKHVEHGEKVDKSEIESSESELQSTNEN
jgi:hypothetical protein